MCIRLEPALGPRLELTGDLLQLGIDADLPSTAPRGEARTRPRHRPSPPPLPCFHGPGSRACGAVPLCALPAVRTCAPQEYRVTVRRGSIRCVVPLRAGMARQCPVLRSPYEGSHNDKLGAPRFESCRGSAIPAGI